MNGKISTLFELGTGFHPELTGRENIYLNGAILGLSREKIREKFNEIVEFSELGKFIEMPLKHYSSGMQVRLAFAVAINVDPEILLVDEVLAVGDASFQNKSFSAFQNFKERGVTIVFVSHDLGSVQEICDRAILLHEGEVFYSGSPRNAVAAYRRLVPALGRENLKLTPGPLKRFGEGGARITEVWVEGEGGQRLKVVEGPTFSVKLRVRFLKDLTEPVPGVIILDKEGRQITAANTRWIGFKTGKFRRGEEQVFSFQFPNIFETGSYRISANVVSLDRCVFDWRNDLLGITVRKPFRSGGIVNTPYEVTVG